MAPISRRRLLRSSMVLALCAAAAAGCGKEPQETAPRPTTQVSLTLRAQPEGIVTPRVEPAGTSAGEVMPSELDEIKRILEARAEAAGFSDLRVEPRPPDSLFVEFACAGDPEWAKALLTDTGLLEFRAIPRRYAREATAVGEMLWRDDSGTAVDASDVVGQSPVIVSGRDFAPTSRVEAGPDRRTGVTFSLRDEAREAFQVFTRDHVDTYLAIVFDGELLSCPMIRSAILGEGVIEGGFDEPGGKDRAEKLAILINSGPLPLDLECVDSTSEQLPQ